MMIPPSSLANLVLGYLREEGLHDTVEAFCHECSQTIEEEKSNPLVEPPNLRIILEEYVALKQSANNSNPASVIPSLWRNLDVLIGQLKYHTIPQPKPLSIQPQKAKKKKFYERIQQDKPVSNPSNRNKPRTPSSSSTNTQKTIDNGIQPVQSLIVTGLLAPSSSPSKWQSVRLHGSNVRQESLAINTDHQRSVEITKDHIESTGINRDHCELTEICLNTGSTDIVRDQNGSLETTSDQQGISSRIIRDHQESIGITNNPEESLYVAREDHGTLDNGSEVIAGGHYGITRDQNGSVVHNTDQGSLCSTSKQSSLEPISITSLSNSTVDGGGANIESSEVPCITIDESQEESTFEVNDTAEQMSGVTATNEMLDFSFKSPKRKGNTPKKRHVTKPSPAKVVPQDSYPVELVELQQLLDGEKVADAAMPFLLDTFLNTPMLQEKLAENINKVVGSSSKASEVTEEVIIEGTEKPSTSTEENSNDEQHLEIPVDDILSLLEADPVFESLLSILGNDGTKTSPNKETQTFPQGSSSGTVPPPSTENYTSNPDSQSATSQATESLLLLSNSPPKISTSTKLAPTSKTSAVPLKPLTPEKYSQQTRHNTTTVVGLRQSEDTEVHVRALKFSRDVTPKGPNDKLKKIPISKPVRKNMTTASKRNRVSKKHKKKKGAMVPNRKLLLPSNPVPTEQPAVQLLQSLASSHASASSTLVNESALNGRNGNGIKKTGGTMLQVLQDAAAMEKVQEEAQGTHQINNQSLLSPPVVTQQLLAPNPPVMNFPGGATLMGNMPPLCLPSGLQLMQKHANKINIASGLAQHGNIPITRTMGQDNSMFYSQTQSTCIPQPLPITSPATTLTDLSDLSSAQNSSLYSFVPSFQPSGFLHQTTSVMNTLPHPSQVGRKEMTQAVASPSILSSNNSPADVVSAVSEGERIRVSKQARHLTNSVNKQMSPSSTQLGDISEGNCNKQISNHLQDYPLVCGQGQSQASLSNTSISQQAATLSSQLPGSPDESVRLFSRLSGNVSEQNHKRVPVSNNSINQQTSPSYSQMDNSLKNAEIPLERTSKKNHKRLPSLSPPSTFQRTVSPKGGQSLNSKGYHPSCNVRNPEKETSQSRTVDQPLSFFTQISGLSSTESSPISKKAEDCISSFCSISEHGGTQVTIQNNTCISADVSNSKRQSPALTSKINSKTKCKSKKDLNKKTSNKGAKLCSTTSSDVAVNEVSTTPCSSSVGQGEMTGEGNYRQGQKRSANTDLKENKPKKSKSSKKSKTKKALPKNFDVEKFLSRLHYVEK